MANENIIKLSEGFGEGTVGDVLTLKDENTVGWQTPQGGSTYTPGSMIQIDNDTINIKNDACSAIGEDAIAVGYETSAIGDYSHAEGYCTSAVGQYSHANGYYTSAIGKYSFTNGTHCIASGLEANAEGCYTSALGDQGHTEGNRRKRRGDPRHRRRRRGAQQGLRALHGTALCRRGRGRRKRRLTQNIPALCVTGPFKPTLSIRGAELRPWLAGLPALPDVGSSKTRERHPTCRLCRL